MNLPSGRIQASKYSHKSRRLQAGLLAAIYLRILKRSLQVFFWWSYKERQNHFSSKGPAQAACNEFHAMRSLCVQRVTEFGEFLIKPKWVSLENSFHEEMARDTSQCSILAMMTIYLEMKKILIITICLDIVERGRLCWWLTQFVVVSDFSKFHKGLSYRSSLPI